MNYNKAIYDQLPDTFTPGKEYPVWISGRPYFVIIPTKSSGCFRLIGLSQNMGLLLVFRVKKNGEVIEEGTHKVLHSKEEKNQFLDKWKEAYKPQKTI